MLIMRQEEMVDEQMNFGDVLNSGGTFSVQRWTTKLKGQRL